MNLFQFLLVLKCFFIVIQESDNMEFEALGVDEALNR